MVDLRLQLWLGAIVLCVLALLMLSWEGDDNASSDNERKLTTKLTAPILTYNTLSYLYIVGVEGTGHHGVSPAIATIARTCNKHVLYEMKQLRLDQQKRSTRGFKAQITKFRSTPYTSQDVVLIEDSSFPTGGNFRNGSQAQKKASGFYDLEWIHRELLANVPDIKVKYLYLNRDFYRAVASHPEFDKTFEAHAVVLNDFLWYIDSEYQRIDKNYPNIWRQISYEWFTNMDVYNCTAIVSAVIDFMEWDNCDVEFACQSLNETVRKETKRAIIPEDYAFSQTFNTTLPIPILDISPNRTYNFTTQVSARVPIVIVSDIGPRRAKRSSIKTAFANFTSSLGLLSKSSRVRASLRSRMEPVNDTFEAAQADSIARAHVRHVLNRRMPRNSSTSSRAVVVNKRLPVKLGSEEPADGEPVYQPPSKIISRNEVSMLYLVGLQGSNLRTVSSLLAYTAKSANYHVVNMHPFLSRAHKKLHSTQYKSTLSAFRSSNFVNTKKVLVLFNEIYPLTEELPEPPPGDKSRHGAYNLLWVLTQAQELGFAVKFLYLQRDLKHLVTTVPVPLLGQPIEKRAAVLKEYTTYIQDEYQRIEDQQAGLWVQLRYEWFLQAQTQTLISNSSENAVTCTVLVNAIARHASWAGHNTNTICEHLRSMAFSGAPDQILTATENDTIAAAEVAITIPVLQLSAAKQGPLPPKTATRVTRLPRPRTAVRVQSQAQIVAPHLRTEPAPLSTPVDNAISNSKESKRPSTEINTVSMLYLVGLQGSDLEAVAAALTRIAQAANYRVIAQHPQLVRSQKALMSLQYKSTLTAFKSSKFGTTNKVLLLMHGAFPVAGGDVGKTPAERVDNGLYNLQWVLTQAQSVGVNVQFVYLLREFSHTVVSAPPWLLALPVEKRAQVLMEDVALIREEYLRIEGLQAGLWAQLKYELFPQAQNSTASCTALVTALASHAGWEGCDTAKACLALQALKFVAPVLSLSTQEQKVIESVNVTLPIYMLNHLQ